MNARHVPEQNPMSTAEEHPTDWYLLRGRARGGPYSHSMVREGARGGLISKGDLVWRPGWEDWRDAGAVDGLFAATAAERDTVSPQRSDVPGGPSASDNTTPSVPPPGVAVAVAAENPDHWSFNYVMAHWRGEFSMLAALFGNGTIVGLILLIGATIFATVLKETKLTPTQYAVLIAGLTVICLVSIVWLLVGICRSALRRASRPVDTR
jgi:hypothetical protein